MLARLCYRAFERLIRHGSEDAALLGEVLVDTLRAKSRYWVIFRP